MAIQPPHVYKASTAPTCVRTSQFMLTTLYTTTTAHLKPTPRTTSTGYF